MENYTKEFLASGLPHSDKAMITYPPEMLPRADEGDIVEVWVQDDRPGDCAPTFSLVYRSEGST